LMMDMRTVLEPFTARDLKVTKHNVVKDFVSVASILHVTHLVMFTMTDKAVYMRLCRLPRGPTLTFRVKEFTVARDVRASIRRPIIYENLFKHQPLLVMNAFTTEENEMKLTTSMFRNLFPTFDLNKIDLNDIKRVVLLNFNTDTREIEFRHYAVKVKPVGLTRAVKKIVSSKKVPDLGKFKNMEEVLNRDGLLTESEGEDDVDEFRQVIIPQEIKSRGNLVNEKSAIRLTEIGPRMTLSLFKVEEGLMEGDVLYHAVVKKTPSEIAQLKERKRQQEEEKLKRKKIQEENVRRKRIRHATSESEMDDEGNYEDTDDGRHSEKTNGGDEPFRHPSIKKGKLKGILKKKRGHHRSTSSSLTSTTGLGVDN